MDDEANDLQKPLERTLDDAPKCASCGKSGDNGESLGATMEPSLAAVYVRASTRPNGASFRALACSDACAAKMLRDLADVLDDRQ